jgi:hypothetical protein
MLRDVVSIIKTEIEMERKGRLNLNKNKYF